MKAKILCPNHRYGKILMAYETALQCGAHRSWIFCGGEKGCSRWVRVDINFEGGVTTKLMPRNYHFDFEAVPTLVEGT